jgi:putative glutamine amidotransferase
MNKPTILIPTALQTDATNHYNMGRNYIRSIVDTGGVPVMVPVALAERDLRQMYDMADGVLLAGGPDVAPSAFGEEPHEKTAGVEIERDVAEYLLARWAVADDKPLFGICRGIQSLNVALGGSLVQDIPTQWQSDLTHNGHYEKAARDQVLHIVDIDAGSRVEAILAGTCVGVNSFHHQAVKRVADGFMVTSRAPDGIIESIEMPDLRFMVGVQWHPEEMSQSRPDMLNLFVSFVSACAAISAG